MDPSHSSDPAHTPAPSPADVRPPRTTTLRPGSMSYKFQRLREKLREAIRGGEFSGKLPGERALAKRFGVNAKTLSKALTDLAAEGLLDRSIGRGTYVKGSAPANDADGRWLVICDAAGGTEPCIISHLRERNPLVESVTDVADLRPSFLNQFEAVIDASPTTPEPFLRNLVVRNVPVVAVGHEPRTYSVHTVLPDAALGVAQLGRELLLSGHRRIAAVEVRGGPTVVSHALRQAAARYAPDAVVDGCPPEDVGALLDDGATAVVCDSVRSAEQVAKALAARGAAVSLAAVGCVCDKPPCSGYFVPCKQLVDSVVQLLRDPPARPAAVWLAGDFADLKTLSARTSGPDGAARPAAPLHLGGVLV
jgi:regulatory GntR family protein